MDQPQQIGPYEIARLIATDAWGVVYAVRKPGAADEVYLRLLSDEKSRVPTELARIVLAILKQLQNDWSQILALSRVPGGCIYVVAAQLAALTPEPAQLEAVQPTQADVDEVMGRLLSTLVGGSVTFGIGERLGKPPRQLPPEFQYLLSDQRVHRLSRSGGAKISIPVPAFITRLFTRQSMPDPVEQAWSELDPGWFSVDAPSEMQVGTAVKLSAGAIRQAVNRELLAATLEHDQAQLEATPLGKLIRCELIADSEEDFQIRALSVAEQPVLSSEPTRWEWLVTPRLPGEQKSLRVVATNLVDINGQRVGKSHPVKTLYVRVVVRSELAQASISSATLRKICDEAMRVDAELEAFVLDFFPSVHQRFARGMERVEKLNLLFSVAPAEHILHQLKQAYPDAVAAVSLEPPPQPPPAQPPPSRPKSAPTLKVSDADHAQKKVSRPSLHEPPEMHIVIPVWALVAFILLGGLTYMLLRIR